MSRKAKRRIKAAKISLLSLVPRGANRVRSLFKDDATVELSAVAKIDAEGYLTTLVYVPDMVDSQGDVATADTVKQMAHEFIANMEGNGIDVMHNGKPVGNDRAHLCETFIVQKNDPRFAGITDDEGNPIDPTNSWGVVMKLDDPYLIEHYVLDEWVGISMFGEAVVEQLDKQHSTANLPASGRTSRPSYNQEIDMDEAQMTELLKQFGASLSENIVAGLTKALTPEPTEPTPAPETPAVEFEGDYMNAEDVAKHADKVFYASLDMSKPEDVAKWQAHIAERQDTGNQPEPNPNQDRIEALEKELQKLRRAPTSANEPSHQNDEDNSLQAKLAKSKARAQELKKQGVIR